MKITAELDISAIVVGEDEWLFLVIPSAGFAGGEDGTSDPLIEDLKVCGLGDRVFILYCDGVQMAKVRK